MDGEKFRFVPTVSEGETVSEPVPAETAGKYPCPCCGYLTFPVPKEDALAYICPVCFWENDVFAPEEDAPSDENWGMTLQEGRENFHRFGAVRPDLAAHARPPMAEELPEIKKGDA